MCAEGGQPIDRNCEMGCIGLDGQPGTSDDSIDPHCTHRIDQGVICTREDSPQQINQAVQTCGAGVSAQTMCVGCDISQAVVFSCVEYYTTQCVYDVTHEQLANGLGSYLRAMQAFAACADVVPEPLGYCHGALASASSLANQDVCMGAGADDPSTPDVDESKGSNHDVSTATVCPRTVV